MRLTTLAAVLTVCLSAVAVSPMAAEKFGSQGAANGETNLMRDIAISVADNAVEMLANGPAAKSATKDQLAQFQLPKPTGKAEGPATAAPSKVLPFEYVWGTELEIPYAQNLDLDNRLKDQTLIFAPTVFGSVTYRPANWLETRLEVTLEKLLSAIEQDPVVLPDGTLQPADRKAKPFSLLIDQMYARFKPPNTDIEFTVGRRNFEDRRLWLYDAALDAAILTFKLGDFHIDASVSREDLMDLDLTAHIPLGKVNNYMVYSEYRGIEDHKLGAYWIFRDDTAGKEGKPHFLGLRAMGRPFDAFNYWTELAWVTGTDEDRKSLSGGAIDVGGTYRFLNAPLQPSITLGFAYGSGDGNPDNGTNTEFRQTGLQSNEGRFGGVTQFVTYGEVLNPELSNLTLITAGVGFRPAASIFVDLVYHQYWLNEIANELRSTDLTAQMNEFTRSKNIGSELDVIVGFRNLFGVKGLGFETRAGVFFPGEAWRRNDGTHPDLGVSALGVFFF